MSIAHAPESLERSLRRVSAGAGVLYLAQAITVTVIVSTGERMLLPVTLDLPGGSPGGSDPTPRFLFSEVDAGLAVVALLVFSALVRFVAASPPVWPHYLDDARANRHTLRFVELGIASPVTVFLVAQLNGITDTGALVAIYALTTAPALFNLVQERVAVPDPLATTWQDAATARSMLPYSLGTMVGIVPWGIIALHQVGAALAGDPASVIVQLTTMSVLVLTVATSIVFWRDQKSRDQKWRSERGASPATFEGERTYLLLSVATTSLFGWLVVTAVLAR